jgi:hypothetical protein
MIRKRIMVIFALAIILFAAAFFFIRGGIFPGPKSGAVFSADQLKDAMQKSGGQELLGKEVAEAVLRFGNNHASADDLTNCPAITKMASLIGGEILGMWPSSGVPAHIMIRRGGHFDYQFVYIFETRSVPTSSSEGLIHVGGPVYLRNTSKQ